MNKITNNRPVERSIPAPLTSNRLRFILTTLFLSIVALTGSLQAQVVFDAASSNFATGGSTITVSHTTGAGANRLMLVGVSTRNRFITTGLPGDDVLAVTYDGEPLTFVGSEFSNTDAVTYIFMFIDPPSGTFDLEVNFTSGLGGSNAGIVGVTTYSNVDLANPIGTYTATPGNSATPSLTIPSTTTSQTVFNVLTVTDNATITLNSGQTQRWLFDGSLSGNRPTAGGYTRAGLAGSTTLNYTLSNSRRWSLSGVAINPVPVSDLQVVKTVNFDKPFAGQTITFTLTATNNGPDAAPEVVVQDLLPSGLTYVSHTAPGGTQYNPGGGNWDIGTLANGQSVILTIQAIVNPSGSYLNTATITGRVLDNVADNNTSSVTLVLCQAGGTRPLFSN
jgi:uncharacterized repeat protein (TIGR01451 family)